MLKRFKAKKKKYLLDDIPTVRYLTDDMIEEINTYAKENGLYIKQVVYFCEREAVVLLEKDLPTIMPLSSEGWKSQIE